MRSSGELSVGVADCLRQLELSVVAGSSELPVRRAEPGARSPHDQRPLPGEHSCPPEGEHQTFVWHTDRVAIRCPAHRQGSTAK